MEVATFTKLCVKLKDKFPKPVWKSCLFIFRKLSREEFCLVIEQSLKTAKTVDGFRAKSFLNTFYSIN